MGGSWEALVDDQNLKIEKLLKWSHPADGLNPASTPTMSRFIALYILSCNYCPHPHPRCLVLASYLNDSVPNSTLVAMASPFMVLFCNPSCLATDLNIN